MTDQNSQFFVILTAVGEAKQANADALGVPWSFSQMGVGDANGTDPIPSRTQTSLINERRRAQLNQLKVDPANPNFIIAEQVIPPDVGGWWIREIGLYDADGDLVAVANCAPSFKPLLSQGTGKTQVVRLNIIVTSTANVQLKIDPAVVLATRAYVDGAIVEVLPKNKTAGEFTRVKINDRGVVISGDNPATLAANGITDAYTKVQVDALFDELTSQVQEIAVNGPVVGSSRNAKMSVPVTSASAAFTADDLVVSTPAGIAYRLRNFNKSINLAAVGIGGMDTGAAPVSGFVAVYAIYNPETGVSALLATNATSVKAPEIYGGANMPAGFTASALVSVWRTDGARLLTVGSQEARRIETPFIGLLDINTDTAVLVPVSISTYVPINAKTLSGQLVAGNNSTVGASVAMDIAGSLSGIGSRYFNAFVLATGTAQVPFFDMPILTPQTMYTVRTITGGGPGRYQVLGAAYTF